MKKSCQRCNSVFECRNDNCVECECFMVSLTKADFVYIGENYNDCLCTKCLLELKNERLVKETGYKTKKTQTYIKNINIMKKGLAKKQNYIKERKEIKNVKCSEVYKKQYAIDFVDKWDELINWDARSKSEGSFFIEELKKRRKKIVLDAATGTGYHSVKLLQHGFNVWSVDGSANMLAKAFENGKKRNLILKTVQTDWRWLSKEINNKFDTVLCLGNSFTHLFDENDRRKTLAEFYSILKHDGILIIDHRNYDSILEDCFSTKHTYYYAGKNVKAEPEHVEENLVRFRYEFPDSSVYNLNMFPLRKDYTIGLLKEVGFQNVKTYGDFEEKYKSDTTDFYIHIAEKEYLDSSQI